MSHDGALDVHIDLPDWARGREPVGEVFGAEHDRMRLAIELARANVTHRSGGPFGAAIFEADSGRLVAVGVNSVVRLHNAVLHAEIVACMRAQARLASFTLSAPGFPPHELVTSCEPCAMCLGAILWSGLKRIVFGALREDAQRLNFEEGPVFPQTYEYLAARGVQLRGGVLREDAAGVLESYLASGGPIYNG
jgi:tRNA(Arg) A34 adenosine deaminase TadA